jgi:hypothetical protein
VRFPPPTLPIVVALALRSVARRAGPGALHRHWPGSPDGLAAVMRLADVADARFRGLLCPGSERLGAEEELVAVWRATAGVRFQNYRATFTVLGVPTVKRAWLNEIIAGNPLGTQCPDPWRTWVRDRTYTPLLAPPTVLIRTRAQQLPTHPDRHRLRHELPGHARTGMAARLSARPRPDDDGQHQPLRRVQAPQLDLTSGPSQPSAPRWRRPPGDDSRAAASYVARVAAAARWWCPSRPYRPVDHAYRW